MVGILLSTSFDAGVPLRDVQEAASHADPRNGKLRLDKNVLVDEPRKSHAESHAESQTKVSDDEELAS